MGFITYLKNKLFKKKVEKRKLAIALGSGGAKGFAHLGALKAFEEEGISFNIVTGTSIGSIVGALYARGYSATDIYELIKTVRLGECVKFVRFGMSLSPVEKILDGYLDGRNIEDLKLPYACVATDEDTNERVVLTRGNAARACCASSAMPPFFVSVEVGGRNLADGAFTDAIPSDAARSLGADVVIGIDLSAKRAENKGHSLLSGLMSSVSAGMVKEKELINARSRGYNAADYVVAPDLSHFSATDISFASWERMFDVGYYAVKDNIAEIKKIINAF